MSPLLHRVRAFAARHVLWHPKTRAIVALSGGSDSVALLRILHELQANGTVRLDAAAHFNHGIRGMDADTDEQFCRDLCAALDVPLVAGRADVPALARRDRTSVEVAARRARRDFLLSVLATRGADRMATAHTRDDQAETVLLRLVRGAGLKGVGAIAPRRGPLVRPLLGCARNELRAYLDHLGQPWRDDVTNDDVSLPRNRMRHEVLPRLEAFNPQVRQALARFADLARDDEDYLDREATALAVHLVRRDADRIALETVPFNGLPAALARRLARLALEAAGHSQPTLRDVDALMDLAAGRAPAVEVPGLRMEPSDGFVVLLEKDARPPASPFSLELTIPGSVMSPAGGWFLTATGPMPRHQGALEAGSATRVAVDASRLGSTLVVRSRRPGDWLRPVGLGGRKKVQDVLVDRKVRAETRDRVPIVAISDGRIVWVAGHALDAGFRASSDTNAVVILELRRIG